MPTYVAFLRAINLGATRKFPKADIVAATEAAGGTDVATHINTGNVLLTTTLRSRAKVEAALERRLEADRGFAVPTIVFTPAEICGDRRGRRRARGHGGRHYVSLLKEEPTAAGDQGDRGGRHGRRARRRARPRRPPAPGRRLPLGRLTNAQVEKALGVATNRNLTVIRALAEKWCG